MQTSGDILANDHSVYWQIDAKCNYVTCHYTQRHSAMKFPSKEVHPIMMSFN